MLLQNVEESVYPGSDISYNSIREKTFFFNQLYFCYSGWTRPCQQKTDACNGAGNA